MHCPPPRTTVPGCSANRTRLPPWSTPSSTSSGLLSLGSALRRLSELIVSSLPELPVIEIATSYVCFGVSVVGGGGGGGVVVVVVVVVPEGPEQPGGGGPPDFARLAH